MTVALYVVEILGYLFLGSGEQQSWNNTQIGINSALAEGGNATGNESTPLNDRETKNYQSES